MRFGFLELVAVLAIILLLAGPKQLPKLAESLRKSKEVVREKTEKDTAADAAESVTDGEEKQ